MPDSNAREVVDVMSKAQWDAFLKGKVLLMMMLGLPWNTNRSARLHKQRSCSALPKPHGHGYTHVLHRREFRHLFPCLWLSSLQEQHDQH